MRALLVAVFCLGGCFRHLATEDHPLHQRVAITRGDVVLVAELYEEAGAATLHVTSLDGTSTKSFSGAEASAIAADVRRGAPLEGALGAAWPGTGELPLCGATPLRTGEQKDPRYGRRQLVEWAEGGRRIVLLHLAPDAKVRLCPTDGERALVIWEVGAHPARTRDVQVLDLRRARGRLWKVAAAEALDAGDLATAQQALTEGFALLGPDPALLWLRARWLAGSGGPSDEILADLGRAIEHDPPLYRMKARTEPAFGFLGDDPRFRTLVAPRPLQGGPRLRASPPAPPSVESSR